MRDGFSTGINNLGLNKDVGTSNILEIHCFYNFPKMGPKFYFSPSYKGGKIIE